MGSFLWLLKACHFISVRNCWAAAVFVAIIFLAPVFACAQEPLPVKIGVLAKRGMERSFEELDPTAAYLNERISGFAFKIVPLEYDTIYSAVENKDIDFILVNPSFYVELERWYGVNRIATLKQRCTDSEGYCKTYGGVVFWLKNRKGIQGVRDLIGKSFMASNEYSLGGWRIIWRELKEQGIDPYEDFSRLEFSETHDNVVYAVKGGHVDAGGVRTGILERMDAEGQIRLEDFNILEKAHEQPVNIPFLCSTREYPEWPFAKLRNTSDLLAEKVTVALLQMPPDSAAAQAADVAGWTIPLNYQSVHECLRYLKIGPYQNLGKITIGDVFQNYGHWIFVTVLAFAGTGMFIVIILRLNRNIADSHRRLQAEINEHQKTDEALKTAKELAETCTQAKSEFLANMSHEIRTPMNGVIAAAELALNEALSPKVHQYLKIIRSSAYSLLTLLNDILDFSKIEAGKLTIESRPFILDEVLDRVVDLFINSASAKRIELLVDIYIDTPRALLGDPLRLQQILTNLVGNAVKFTEKGGFILIRVKPAEVFSDQVNLEIAVIDTGVGIPPDFADTLFKPFTQADSSDTRRYEGTGLGLSICRRLVEMMRGRIWVESELGKGSTFTFSIQLGRQSEEPKRQFHTPPDIQHINILVVDDCEQSCAIVVNILKSFGFKSDTAANGFEALTEIRDKNAGRSPYDLVIIDWLMPGRDGLEVSKQIREEFSKTLPIIMMTAFGRDSERLEAEKIGINGFLTKPIYHSTLFNAIMEAFGKESYKTRRLLPGLTTDASIFKRRLKGFRVLVVEDNPTNQEIAVAIMESAGILTETANNGRQALEMLKSQQFDAVLMDVQMPEMNGYEATRIIRSDASFDSLPVIAMTAHAMRGDEQKCMAAGMDGYISKPVNQYRLFQLMWRLLKNRQSVMESEGFTPESEAESAQEMPPLPDRAEGIFIRDVLDATKLEPAVYRRILSGFLRNNTETIISLRQAISDGNLKKVAMLAHTLKGSSANIGAKDLEAAARKLEILADTEKNVSALMSAVDRLESALSTVVSSIRTIETQKTPLPESFLDSDKFDPEKTVAALEELSSALDRSDPQATEQMMERLKNLVSRESYLRLEQMIGGYDYDQATETVSRMLREMKAD